jgi:DNA-binding NarL/FixJ family response regulator
MLVEPSTLAAVLSRIHEPERSGTAPPGPHLTQRQQAVLALMAEGLDPRAIARTLGISLNTSRGHVKAIMGKLGAHSQLEAVVQALHLGMLEPEGAPGPTMRDGPSNGAAGPAGR